MYGAGQAEAARCIPPPSPASVVVAGGRRDGPLVRSLLAAAGERGRWLAEPPDPEASEPATLVIGVHALDDDAGRGAFAQWSTTGGTPRLAAVSAPDRLLLGPLAVPGRVGCGRCALDRMSAAAAGRPRKAGPAAPARALSADAAAVLEGEIERILGGGAGASPLLDHVVEIDPATGAATLHRVIPLPHCPVCGGAAALPPAPRESAGLPDGDSAEELLEALAGWVDPLTGVIPDLIVDRRDGAGAGEPIVITAAPPHVVDPDGSLRRLPLGWGKGADLASAVRSAVGEAVERYAPSLPDPARIVWQRPDELPGDRLDPRDLPLYSEEQYRRPGFPYPRFDPELRHPWVLGRWLASGEPVWVPAVAAFLSLEIAPAHLFCQGSSNGLAAGAAVGDAALRATFELIERDALLAAWSTGSAGVRIALDGAVDPGLLGPLHAVESLGGAIELYLLPTGACGTTVLALALGDGERWPGVTIGLGTDLEPASALRQAILELGQTGPHLRRLMRSGALPAPPGPQAVNEMLDHAAYWFPPERAAAFDRLRSGTGTIPASELPAAGVERSTEGLAAALATAGVRVAVVDVTSPDVATGPFRVVRAVSPDLQPITFGHGLDRAPVARIRRLGPLADPPPVHPIW